MPATLSFERADAAYSPTEAGLQDFYPESEEDHGRLVSWVNSVFLDADSARKDFEDRWRRFYKLRRSYVTRDKKDWRSKVFYPICFQIIETVTPRLVASMPSARVLPIGPGDEPAAKVMESYLNIVRDQSDLYLQQVSAVRSALTYGTGILKTFQREDRRRARRKVPMMQEVVGKVQEPIMDENGIQEVDLDGELLFSSREVSMGQVPVDGQFTWESYEYLAYDGPAAEAVDLFNFWVAPEADSVQGARYVVERKYREMSYILAQVENGFYRLPPGLSPEQIADTSDEPHLSRLREIGYTAGGHDSKRRPVELLEVWTDDGRVITLANRKAILRCHENPFDHGQKPYIRIVDYMNEHEFYGSGEIEAIEGLQDLTNVIVNSRVDNLRLILNAMFAVNTKYIEDMRDLVPRPGGVIRVRDDIPVSQVIQRIDFGNVTQQAFTEAQMTMQAIEQATGVNAYTAGQDSPSLNDTATGVSLLQEAGSNRFAMKARLQELMGYKDLFRQFAGNVQQFTTTDKVIRVFGEEGQIVWQTLTPESIAGSFDFEIETSSAAQTESKKRSEAMNLFQLLMPAAPEMRVKLIEDVLDAFDRKDKAPYLQPVQFAEQMKMAMMGAQMGGVPGQPPMPGGAGPGPGGQAVPPGGAGPAFPPQAPGGNGTMPPLLSGMRR